MASVLPKCKDDSLPMSHCLQDSISLDKSSAIFFGSNPGMNKAPSTAYRFKGTVRLKNGQMVSYRF